MEASPSPVYGAALLMRFGSQAHREFKSPRLRPRTRDVRAVLHRREERPSPGSCPRDMSPPTDAGRVAALVGLLFGLAGMGSAAARAAFVIDKAGVIQYSEQTPTPKDLPNFDAVKAKLSELQR